MFEKKKGKSKEKMDWKYIADVPLEKYTILCTLFIEVSTFGFAYRKPKTTDILLYSSSNTISVLS